MSNYEFGGIGYVEAQDRKDEYRTGVPGLGDGQALLDAPAPGARQILSKVHVHNTGEHCALLRMRHQGATKTVAAEILTALAVAGNRYVGQLQHRSITPGSVVITEAGALANIVDDGAGVLHDVGIPANVRGSINYTTGVVDWTWGGAATQLVTIAYTHTDGTDFATATQNHTVACVGAFPETFQLPFGRVNPGSVAFNTNAGALTFVDDGKGNIVETTPAGEAVRGTIDYGTGLITVTGSSGGPLAGNFVGTYTFNPFAGVVRAGGGQALYDMYAGMIPELTTEPWADGLRGEERLWLWGEGTTSNGTRLVTQWYHASEDPFRVEAPYSGFPPGGNDNDPRLA